MLLEVALLLIFKGLPTLLPVCIQFVKRHWRTLLERSTWRRHEWFWRSSLYSKADVGEEQSRRKSAFEDVYFVPSFSILYCIAYCIVQLTNDFDRCWSDAAFLCVCCKAERELHKPKNGGDEAKTNMQKVADWSLDPVDVVQVVDVEAETCLEDEQQ